MSKIERNKSRVLDAANLLTQMFGLKDLERSDSLCIRSSIALLFGADFIPDSQLLGLDCRDTVGTIVEPALSDHDVLPSFPRTGSEFAAHMAEEETLGALVFTSVERTSDHVIGILPEGDGNFLVVDTSKENGQEMISRIDEEELIDLYAIEACIAFPVKSGGRSVVVFRDGAKVIEEMHPFSRGY